MRFKKLTEYWKKLTITLALPILIINSVMDYYYGWESRVLEKETQKIQEQKDNAFQYHSHHYEDKYEVVIDVDGQEVKLLQHQKGDIIIPDNLDWSFLDEYDETPQ